MSLFDAQRHVNLAVQEWQPEIVQAWLQKWSQAASEIWAEQQAWPVHPRDASDFEVAPTALHSLYCGSFGVWLALARLSEAGFGRLETTLAEKFQQVYAAYCAEPDTGTRVPSWFLGESALLTALELRSPDPGQADRLSDILKSNVQNPTREALWGAPGTLIAALMLWERTHQDRWENLFRECADAIWSSWFRDPDTGVWLWEQDMYGRQSRYIGAGHGWAGNLYGLWRGQDLLTPEQRELLHDRTVDGLEKLARLEDKFANWPPQVGQSSGHLLQWCHGAPGMITALRHARLSGVLPLLRKGGELILLAGPLAKGAGLCHGTAGNGMALLELYQKTHEERWLDQARQFAMWALQQSQEAYAVSGQWHYSLWTGDAGLACFLLDCLESRSSGMPGVDAFW